MRILSKDILGGHPGQKIIKFIIESPLIAGKAKPGQFVVIMAGEKGERIPLTIVDNDAKKGTITLIVQEAGFTTKLLGRLAAGESLYALLGPLGKGTEIKKYGKVVLIGGGVGIAEIYPVAKAFKDAGNHVTAVVGARTKKMLILENELKKFADDFFVVTDDGSYGEKGFTTDVLKKILNENKYDLVYAVGPVPMMKKTALLTKDYGVRTLVSLNSLMVDATGMCGCCRVTIRGKVKFTCIDGPEFDAQLIDWEELISRNKSYERDENHICRLTGI